MKNTEAPDTKKDETSGSSKSRPVKRRSGPHQLSLKGKDTANAKAYSSSERYVPGDYLQHPIFGLGVATEVKDGTKVAVLFECGSKLLIHDR